MSKILSTLRGMYELLYPRLCMCCLEEKTAGNNTVFCLRCHSSFPFTDHFTNADNLLMHHFYGRVKVVKAASLMYFNQREFGATALAQFKVQRHESHWNGFGCHGCRAHVAFRILHPNHRNCSGADACGKKKQRGYNQSEVIAQKISEGLNIPLLTEVLIKNKSTVTQTHKGRQDRLENIKGSFTCRKTKICQVSICY